MDYCYICLTRGCTNSGHVDTNSRLQMQMMQQQATIALTHQGSVSAMQHFQASLKTYPTEIIDNERNKNNKNKKLLLLRK